jgi:hypothetical protein
LKSCFSFSKSISPGFSFHKCLHEEENMRMNVSQISFQIQITDKTLFTLKYCNIIFSALSNIFIFCYFCIFNRLSSYFKFSILLKLLVFKVIFITPIFLVSLKISKISKNVLTACHFQQLHFKMFFFAKIGKLFVENLLYFSSCF